MRFKQPARTNDDRRCWIIRFIVAEGPMIFLGIRNKRRSQNGGDFVVELLRGHTGRDDRFFFGFVNASVELAKNKTKPVGGQTPF